MLEHEATAIYGFVILAPAPVRVYYLVLATSTALLDVKVALLIV
jgi:hypothetical protein